MFVRIVEVLRRFTYRGDSRLLKGGFEFAVLVATAMSFGRSARQNKANPGPIGRRADEFDASGFKRSFDIEESRRSAGRHFIEYLEALDRLNANTRSIGQFLDRPSKSGTGRSNLGSRNH
jgi:hypothetical protein